jgi:adenylyltransferase/sulfurtransferase
MDMQLDRYNRQMLLPRIGRPGQLRLAESRVLLVGCGALGTVIADQLVRAGVGWLRLVDRDTVELSNLQRQSLFDESDAANETPKAIAAAARLRQFNSQVHIEPVVTDVDSDNIATLLDACGRTVDLMLDGTDNAETRFLLNDAAIKWNVPWVYGGCVGTEGRVMAITPGQTPCLRCVFREPPAPAELPTCSTAGVLGSATALVASLQATAAIQLLIGTPPPMQLISFDIWTGRSRAIDLSDAKRTDCPACGQKQFEFLERAADGWRTLCGKNAIQFRAIEPVEFELESLAKALSATGNVVQSPQLLRYQPADDEQVNFAIFRDGRVIIHGVGDPARARTLYARYLGG